MEWQPIETAPKGELVLLHGPYIIAPGILHLNRWYFWEGEFCTSEDGEESGELNYWLKGFEPTHWMPLPEPPK